MLTRFLIVALLFIFGYGYYTLLTRRQIKKLAQQDRGSDPILRRLKQGVPAVVYFTTPHCIPCITQQQPTLNRLVETLGDNNIQVLKIDATQDPESADRWGVLSAPTTFVVDAHGRTQAVNHGVANLHKLTHQLSSGI